jgi:hypothetical protein
MFIPTGIVLGLLIGLCVIPQISDALSTDNWHRKDSSPENARRAERQRNIAEHEACFGKVTYPNIYGI